MQKRENRPFEGGGAAPVKVREPLRLRFGLLWAVLFLVFLGAILLLRYLETFEYRDALAHQRSTKIEMLHHLLELKGASLRQFADDYSQWDEMVEFSRSRSPEWAKVNIEASLRNFQACGAWVYTTDGELAYAVDQGAHPPALDGSLLRTLYSREKRESLYLHHEGQLYEYRVAQLFSSADVERRGESFGWYVVARLWNTEQFESLGILTQSKVSFVKGALEPDLKDGQGGYQLSYALRNPAGGVLGWLLLDCKAPDIVISLAHDVEQTWVFVCFVLVMVGIVFFCLRVWIFQPLQLIDRSLVAGEAGPLEPLESDRSELGHLARLVKDSFVQRRLLREEVEARRLAEESLRKAMDARAEFARNLHDGAIQTLFAAGMGVGGALPLVEKQPEEARRRIEQSRLMLNEVIREMRGFIAGLEPEAFEGDFAESLQRMAGHMQGLRPFTPEFRIETLAEEDLSTSERVQLLYVAREALSNALRHGQASRVCIDLRREGACIVFRIEDDGVGLSSSGAGNSGHGLANIRQRAQELGAELELCEARPHGLVVRISIQTQDPS